MVSVQFEIAEAAGVVYISLPDYNEGNWFCLQCRIPNVLLWWFSSNLNTLLFSSCTTHKCV